MAATMNSLLHFLRFAVGLDEQSSQLTAAETELLLRHLEGAQVFVEIGCYEGKTCCAAARRGVRQVYSVDPFPSGRLAICYGEWIARIQRRRDKSQNLTFMKALSWEAAPAFDQPIDALFIDADHRYEAVQQDWEQWSPKVTPGGIIALHDCRIAPNSPDYLGSHRFYEHDVPRFKRVKELAAIDSLAIFRVLDGCGAEQHE
jgi:hypothetical protein